MSAICQMTPQSSHWAIALCVRSVAISVRTWRRIGRPMLRRAHPDHPRACSALTTEGHLNAERAKKRLRSSTRRQHWQDRRRHRDKVGRASSHAGGTGSARSVGDACIIADYLIAADESVFHILGPDRTEPARMTNPAPRADALLIYAAR